MGKLMKSAVTPFGALGVTAWSLTSVTPSCGQQRLTDRSSKMLFSKAPSSILQVSVKPNNVDRESWLKKLFKACFHPIIIPDMLSKHYRRNFENIHWKFTLLHSGSLRHSLKALRKLTKEVFNILKIIREKNFWLKKCHICRIENWSDPNVHKKTVKLTFTWPELDVH